MLFGKKKEEEATNPYFNKQAIDNQATAPVTPTNPTPPPMSSNVILPTPLPPPPQIPTPIKEDAERPYAFIKLSEFKEIVNSLEEIEVYIQNLRSSAEELAKALEQENEILKRYISAQEEIRKAIDEIKALLSQTS